MTTQQQDTEWPITRANNVLVRFRPQQGQYAPQAIVVQARYNYVPLDGEWVADDPTDAECATGEFEGAIAIVVRDCPSGRTTRSGNAVLDLYRPDYASGHAELVAAVAEMRRRIGRDVPVQINLPAQHLHPDTPAAWSRTVLQRFDAVTP